MVYLTSRFLFLAALVATVAMPTFVLQSDARTVDLTERHSDKSELSSSKHVASQFVSSKNKGKTVKNPTVPLPASAKKEKSKNGKKSKDHKKGDHIDNKRDTPLLMADMMRREADPKHHHPHHHHHHDKRQEQEAQFLLSLEKRGNSRIYGKLSRSQGDTWDMLDPLIQIGDVKVGDGRNGKYSDTHGLLGNIFKRSPEPHHHHHHHHDHDKVVVNGDNDKVHVHERRGVFRADLGVDHEGSGTDADVEGGNNSSPGKRAPHHHHHHDHHGHHEDDKTVVNGDNDDVHIHERRVPHHHHHHHHDDDHHDKTVINGNNDDVHVHKRDAMLLETKQGLVMGTVDRQHANRRDDNGSLFAIQKRSGSIDSNAPGVPGTIDIVAVGGPVKEKLASLILSTVPDNETMANSSLPLNGTKDTEDVDVESSPFMLDASNTTQTQFYLVAQNPVASSSSSSSLANTLAVLKAATSTKADDAAASDIPVKLQIPVFDPSKAAESMYCATYDPNPPKPAPLTMEKCATSDPINSGKMTETSLHKSQTFAYNPTTQTLRLMWFNVNNGSLPVPPANSTSPFTSPTSTSNSNSTSGHDGKQMNFKIQTSNKNAQILASEPDASSLPIQLPAPLANGTQQANETVSSTPIGNATASSGGLSSQNVALIFTPLDPMVRTASVPDDIPSFGPSDHSANSDLGDDDGDDGDNDVGPSSASVSTSVAASATDSNSATSTDRPSADIATTSFAMDASSTALGSTSDAATPSETMMIDDAAIEKMYQHNFSN